MLLRGILALSKFSFRYSAQIRTLSSPFSNSFYSLFTPYFSLDLTKMSLDHVSAFYSITTIFRLARCCIRIWQKRFLFSTIVIVCFSRRKILGAAISLGARAPKEIMPIVVWYSLHNLENAAKCIHMQNEPWYPRAFTTSRTFAYAYNSTLESRRAHGTARQSTRGSPPVIPDRLTGAFAIFTSKTYARQLSRETWFYHGQQQRQEGEQFCRNFQWVSRAVWSTKVIIRDE